MTCSLVHVSKTMGISHEEFRRCLALAFDKGVCVQADDTLFVMEYEGRKLDIGLSDEEVRFLGKLALPSVVVTLTFKGWAQGEIDRFLVRFDRAFQRGGG